jgi:hypothetical protein
VAERVLTALGRESLTPDALEAVLVEDGVAVEADLLAGVLAELLADGRVVRDGAHLAGGSVTAPAEMLR